MFTAGSGAVLQYRSAPTRDPTGPEALRRSWVNRGGAGAELLDFRRAKLLAGPDERQPPSSRSIRGEALTHRSTRAGVARQIARLR